MALILSIALAALALLRRAPHPAFTAAWQVRGAASVSAVLLGGLLLGRGDVIGAVLLFSSSALVALRLATERAAARATSVVSEPQPTLSVVTHNCGLHRSDPVRIAAFLADCGADVIAVQEIDETHAVELRRALAETHSHEVVHATGIDGLALFSRYPVLEARLEPDAASHPHLTARLDAPGGPLHVTVVHPPASLAFRGVASPAHAGLVRLAGEAAANAPAIVLGDLNSTDGTHAWDALADAGLVDAYRAVGGALGATFPVPFKYLGLPVPPVVRIDFVFASPDLAPTYSEVGPSTTSDHLPLFATFTRERAAGDDGGWRARVG